MLFHLRSLLRVTYLLLKWGLHSSSHHAQRKVLKNLGDSVPLSSSQKPGRGLEINLGQQIQEILPPGRDPTSMLLLSPLLGLIISTWVLGIFGPLCPQALVQVPPSLSVCFPGRSFDLSTRPLLTCAWSPGNFAVTCHPTLRPAPTWQHCFHLHSGPSVAFTRLLGMFPTPHPRPVFLV